MGGDASEPFEVLSDPAGWRRASVVEAACVCGIGGLLCAALFLGSFLPLALALAWLGGLFASAVVRDFLLRQHLLVEPASGAVDRTFLFLGRPVARRRGWLRAGDVVELHLHRRKVPGRSPLFTWRTFALTLEGRRRLLWTLTGPPDRARDDEVARVVERLAAFFNCTISEFQGEAAPTRDELAEALAERRTRGGAA